MTVIPVVIGALETILKGLVNGLEDLEIWGKVETIHPTALLRLARILRRALETWGDLLSFKLQWKTISLHWHEKLQKEKNNNNPFFFNFGKSLPPNFIAYPDFKFCTRQIAYHFGIILLRHETFSFSISNYAKIVGQNVFFNFCMIRE